VDQFSANALKGMCIFLAIMLFLMMVFGFAYTGCSRAAPKLSPPPIATASPAPAHTPTDFDDPRLGNPARSTSIPHTPPAPPDAGHRLPPDDGTQAPPTAPPN